MVEIKWKELTLLEWLEMEYSCPAFIDWERDNPPKPADLPLIEAIKCHLPFYPYELIFSAKRLSNDYYSVNGGIGMSRDHIVLIEDKD